jgi:hypothetical protein
VTYLKSANPRPDVAGLATVTEQIVVMHKEEHGFKKYALLTPNVLTFLNLIAV